MAPSLSLTEWVVLTLIGEGPTHGFALARELRPDGDLGRVLRVHRPAVYRAMDRLVVADLAERIGTEPGDAGPSRVVHRVTRRGRAASERWLDRPVEHVRDLRIEFLVKLRLQQRCGRDSAPLIEAQRVTLAATLSHLIDETGGDIVDEWRRSAARAARSFLDDLARAGL